MTLVVAILLWSAAVGLTARRLGVVQHALLIDGIVVVIAIHTAFLGPS